MTDKIMMFPEYGNNNANGFGGWGGGLIGLILGALLFGGFGWGMNGFGGMNGMGGYGLAGFLNNNNNTDLVMNAINGTNADVRQLATTLNCDINSLTSAINAVQGAIQQVGANNGMSFQQVINAVQAGNANIASQLSNCCCENRLLTTQQGYEGRIQTIDQTNALSNVINANGRLLADQIAAQTTMITKEFCDLKEREMQSKIDTQAEIITQLRNKESITSALEPIQTQLNAIAAKQPNTVPVQWPNIQAVNTTPTYGFGFNNSWGSNSFWN